MKILIAADGSVWTQRMLAVLAAHDDEWLAGRHDYAVIHAVPRLPVHVEAMASGGAESVRRYYDDEHEKVFGPIRGFFAQRGIAPRWVGHLGAPAEFIADTATAGQFDLVVMGSHGHGALAGLLLGSVATKVLTLCKTPVLLIR